MPPNSSLSPEEPLTEAATHVHESSGVDPSVPYPSSATTPLSELPEPVTPSTQTCPYIFSESEPASALVE